MDKEKTRELMEKSLEFIKDTSVKIRSQAKRRWRVSNLRLEISSQKHQMGLIYKDIGKYSYESTKNDSLDNEKYEEFFIKLGAIEEKIEEKRELIQKIEEEALREESETLVATGEDEEEIRQYQEREDAPVDDEVEEKKRKKKKKEIDDESEIAGK